MLPGDSGRTAAPRWAAQAMLAFALLAGEAHAFDSGEHCTVANLALRVALDYTTSRVRDASVHERLERMRAIMDPSSDECFPESWYRPSDANFSYGKVAALVDYVGNPADLFLRYGSEPQAITGPGDLNAAYFGPHTRLFGRFSIATHNNVEHFQGLLLSSFKAWHDSALAAADRDGGLFDALARSAIADHYLQDFFAPGHMITPRDGLPDVIALSWHDHYNKLGIPVVVRNVAALSPIISFIDSNTRNGHSDYDADFGNIADHRLPRYAAERVGFRQAIAAIEGADGDRPSKCPRDAHDRYKAFPGLSVDSSGPDVSQAPVRVICLYGDGSLDGHAAYMAASIPAQKALMVLVEAHYILEVLDEYTTRTQQPYVSYEWCPRETSVGFYRRKSNATPNLDSQAAGCVRELNRVESLCQAKRCDKVLPPCANDGSKRGAGCDRLYAAPYAQIDFVSYALEPSNKAQTFAVFDPVFSVGTSFRVGKGAESGGALTWLVETLPIGIVGADDFLRDREFRPLPTIDLGLAVGYERALQPSAAFRDAYTARLVWAIPRLDIQMSALAERVSVSSGSRMTSGWGFGGRFEVGFSFLTAFVGLSEDPTLVNGVRERAAMLRAGVAFSFTGERALNAILHL